MARLNKVKENELLLIRVTKPKQSGEGKFNATGGLTASLCNHWIAGNCLMPAFASRPIK